MGTKPAWPLLDWSVSVGLYASHYIEDAVIRTLSLASSTGDKGQLARPLASRLETDQHIERQYRPCTKRPVIRGC